MGSDSVHGVLPCLLVVSALEEGILALWKGFSCTRLSEIQTLKILNITGFLVPAAGLSMCPGHARLLL